ncbi:MAG: lysylphosphatidylglycerol synthase transmembrane domain-containing protein, partial [Acidimicrobiales bacterium]
ALVVVVIVFGVIFPQLVDWDVVFEVLREVDAGELTLIVGLGLLRYVPAGWIYSIVLPGLSLRRGIRAWVATTGVSSTLPGADLALRIGMYSSWGFSIEQTTSGMFLSGVVEMSVSGLMALTALTVYALIAADVGALLVAAIAGLVVVLIAGAIGMAVRSEDLARRFGAKLEPVVRWIFDKFKREAPDDVVDRVLAVRLDTRTVLGSRWPQAFLAAISSQALSVILLFVSLRAVGVDASILSWSDVLIGYGAVLVVTTIPITPGNVGISELAYVGFFTALAGREHSELITAGVILYRLALWLLPIIVGWIVTLRWQATEGRSLFSRADSGRSR